MGPLDELVRLLRPAGGGIHTVSTGRAARAALQAALYRTNTPDEVPAAWRRDLDRIAAARVIVIAIPSDCGAGLVRGTAFGPEALRMGLWQAHPELYTHPGVVDVGDVAVVPHLLHDDMVSDPQKRACRLALYPDLDPDMCGLPVAPLSIAERALERIFDLNPNARILMLGGDHSVAYPVAAVLKRRRAPDLGIVQPDAHTDLLAERLGVRICFATWAYHANEIVGRAGRLVQVGIRASGKPREHWEANYGVRQFWAGEIARLGDAGTIAAIVAHLQDRGVRQIYFSNDIDATDVSFAPATGAPEPGGVTPSFVCALIEALGRHFDFVAGDLVEVAPPIGDAASSRKTVEVGVAYLAATLAALVGTTPS